MTSNRLWVLGAVLASIAIVVLGWVVGISPKLAEAGVATLERQNVEGQNLAQEAAIALLKEQFANIKTYQDDLDELQLSVPSSSQLDTFIDGVTAAAAANGVSIESVTGLPGATYGGSVDPNAAEDTAAVQPAAPAASDPNAPAVTLDGSLVGRFFTVGVSIKVSGSADQVFALTKSLQTGDRLFLVTDVAFDTDGESRATITGFIFVVTDAAVAPATDTAQ